VWAGLGLPRTMADEGSADHTDSLSIAAKLELLVLRHPLKGARQASYPQGIDDLRDVIRQTDALWESVLLPPLGSVVEALTEAVLVIVPADVGLTTMSIVASPLPIVPRLQVTIPPDSPQVPWVDVAETNVTLGGSRSMTVTPEAASGPWLATVSV
jgi:hypothetical protein